MQVICDVGLEIFEWRIAEPSSRGAHRVRGGDRCLYRELKDVLLDSSRSHDNCAPVTSLPLIEQAANKM
jgi:hypothetical protein